MRAYKYCLVCGRTVEWRRKWRRDWDQVRYCSTSCRKRGLGQLDRQLEVAILALLDRRARGASICPSEAARAVASNWRALMAPARMAARRLCRRRCIAITQGGHGIDPDHAKGPIRLRLEEAFPGSAISRSNEHGW